MMNMDALWIWTDGVYLYDIGGNCSMDVLEKMAESLK